MTHYRAQKDEISFIPTTLVKNVSRVKEDYGAVIGQDVFLVGGNVMLS